MILFLILALGLLLGEMSICGLSLGTAGVLFVALLFGHFNLSIPNGIGSFGLILFIYCVGISAGPSFFKSFASQGVVLAKLSALTVAIGAVLTAGIIKIFDIPLDLAIGLFAGALTSTPALASGIDSLKNYGDLVPVGYGIAYPFGVIGVVLFVQLLPKILKKDLNDIEDKDAPTVKGEEIERIVVQVTKQSVIGKPIRELDFLHSGKCVVSRIIKDEKILTIKYDYIIEQDACLLIVGKKNDLKTIVTLLGEKSHQDYIIDVEQERAELVVTSPKVIGQNISEIDIIKNFGIVVTRICRLGETFIPSNIEVLRKNDLLTVAGSKESINKFSQFIAHKASVLEQTDILKLSIALILGILIGKLPIPLPGGKTIMLGLAGGPLFVALLMSYFKKTGQFPVAARNFVQTLGLILFLANAGVKAGGRLVPVLQEHGIALFAYGMILTLVPMFISFIIAYKFLKINLLEALGGVCGGMTSTPALGAITSKTDSIKPITSYAVAYPVALILMTIIVQILASIFI